MAETEGIDLSEWQPSDYDVAGLVSAGVRFAWVNVGGGQGARYRDPKFRHHVEKLRASGRILVGAYRVLRFSDSVSPEEQADIFRQDTANVELDLPHVWDVETETSKSPGFRLPFLARALTRSESIFGHAPVLYTYPSYWNGLGIGATDRAWARYRLWLAAYTDARAATKKYPPKAPEPWARWDVWQYGGDANKSTVPGMRGYLDRNVFRGSLSEFKRWAGLEAIPQPAPEGDHGVGARASARKGPAA